MDNSRWFPWEDEVPPASFWQSTTGAVWRVDWHGRRSWEYSPSRDYVRLANQRNGSLRYLHPRVLLETHRRVPVSSAYATSEAT